MNAKYYHTSKIVLLGFLSLVWLLASGPAVAGDDVIENFWNDTYSNVTQPSAPQEDPQYILWKRLAKAKPDECYQGIGNPENRNSFDSIYPGDMTSSEIEACLKLPVDTDEHGIPKVNQSYVWGLTKQGNNLWFGTVANTLCLAIQMAGLGLPPMQVDKDWVCEGGSLDVRPPRIFIYNVEYKTLEDQTNKVLTKSDADKDLLEATTGLRSAGNNGGVVFLGGISFNGVNLFAFNANTKAYLGSRSYPTLNNIRQWRVIKSQLYVGVGKPGGGEIWRWTGSLTKYKMTKNLDDLFKFEIVGILDADPAYLTGHNNRIFVSTWPDLSNPISVLQNPVLYMSPPFGSDNRLGSADKNGWKVVWHWTDYAVEPAAIMLGGALASYGGYLYWGTMTIPGLGFQVMGDLYPGCPLPDITVDPIPTIEAFFGTYLPIHVFRGSNFGQTTPPKIELLYGLPKLPKFNGSTCEWNIVPNAMGKAPKFGLAGMNNFFNTYTWWMEPFQTRLFVGTFDWLYLAVAVVQELAGVDLPESYKKLAQHFEGGDLFSFKSTSLPAFPASMNGLGNYLNYGIRTMVADPNYLYLGTANAMNLATDPTDKKPEGGWELYKLGIRTECCTSEDSCYTPCY